MAEPFTVACEHCQSKLKLKSAAAVGKKVACPKCKKVFTVRAPGPKSEDDLFDDLPLDDYKPPGEEDQEEEEEAPRKSSSGKSSGAKGKKGGKRKKSSDSGMGTILMSGLLILLGVGALGGVGYAVMKFLPGGGTIAAYLPEEIDTLIHVRVADLVGSPLVSPLLNEPKVKEAIDKGFQESGLKPADVDSVTIGVVGVMGSMGQNRRGFGPPMIGPNQAKQFVAVVKTRAPLNIDQFKTSLKTPVTAANHSGQEYFTASMGGRTLGYFRPNETTLVFGPEEELKKAIDSKGASPAGSRFRFVDLKQHVIVAFGPKEISQFRTHMGMEVKRIDPKTGATTPSTDDIVYGMSVGVTATSDLVIRHDTRYNSSSTAKNSVEANKSDLAEMKSTLDQMKGQIAILTLTMPAAGGPATRIVDQIGQALSSASVAPSGATLITRVTFPGAIVNDVKELAAVAMTTMEQNASGGGGMGFPGMSPPGLPQAGFGPPGLSPGSANPALPDGLAVPPDAAAAAAAATPASPPALPQTPPAAPPP